MPAYLCPRPLPPSKLSPKASKGTSSPQTLLEAAYPLCAQRVPETVRNPAVIPFRVNKSSTPDQTLSSLLRNAGDMDDLESSILSEPEGITAPPVVQRQSRRTPDNISSFHQTRDGSPSPPPRRNSSGHQDPSLDGHSRSKRSSNFYSKDQLGQMSVYQSLPGPLAD